MEHIPNLISIFGWSTLAFLITLVLTPIYLKLVKKFKLGKQIRENTMTGDKASIFKEMHAKKSGTPTMGGVIMWGSVLIVVMFSRLLLTLEQ